MNMIMNKGQDKGQDNNIWLWIKDKITTYDYE